MNFEFDPTKNEGSCSEQVITDQFSDETRRDAFMVHSQFVDGGIA
jgi:hypothetical protein